VGRAWCVASKAQAIIPLFCERRRKRDAKPDTWAF
jgi:hypothetical protein